MISKRLFYSSLCAFLSAFLFAVWLGGLVHFVERVNAYAKTSQEDILSVTDAIVVLTGGSERVHTGIELLGKKKGKKLLISGVYPGVKARHILDSSNLSQDTLACCVVLGHAAEDTRGNALEARDFMKTEGFTSMRLVTAHYHMPRSLLLFRALMPDIEIIPHSASPDIVELASWWQRPGTLNLLIVEYSKYIIVRFLLAFEGA